MRKLVWVGALLVVIGLARPAMAQEEAPKVEAFAGYSYLRARVDTTAAGGSCCTSINFNGGSGQLALNLNHWLGAVGDFGGYTTNSTITVAGTPVTVNTNVVSYLFGPRISFRGDRLTPYGQVLFGGARLANKLTGPGSENAFALAAGGGVDFKVSQHFAIRPAQFEYLLTKFSDGHNDRQNNLRYSAGIVFRW